MLGKFRYMGKPDKQHTAPVKCIIHMFVMHVADELPVWPEMAQRQRFWVSTHLPMRHLLRMLATNCLYRMSYPLCLGAGISCSSRRKFPEHLQLSVEEACAKCRHPWMREALQMWLEQRGWSPRQDCSGLEPQTNGVPVAS